MKTSDIQFRITKTNFGDLHTLEATITATVSAVMPRVFSPYENYEQTQLIKDQLTRCITDNLYFEDAHPLPMTELLRLVNTVISAHECGLPIEGDLINSLKKASKKWELPKISEGASR